MQHCKVLLLKTFILQAISNEKTFFQTTVLEHKRKLWCWCCDRLPSYSINLKICFLCLFKRLFKIQENGAFLFWNIFFRSKILMFLYYGNYESVDVENCTTWMVKYWIKNISKLSRNIEAVFFKLGARNVHHERNKMTPVMLLLWQQFCRWSV